MHGRRRGFTILGLLGSLTTSVSPAYADFDIPTGAKPSPLFGATPFSQQMLLFEELGLHPFPVNPPAHSLPDPLGCDGPASPSAYNDSLDVFLGQPLYPFPQRTANIGLANPWATTISTCIGRPITGVIEGRPSGEHFAHQRYNEFPPQLYFQTAQTGARTNGGLRDTYQLHRFSVGEFGPGGLYHGYSGTQGSNRGMEVRFHPNMPVQEPLSVWTFDGTLPPKLLMATYGTPILNRHYNALPISDAANNGFGRHTISTHEHNGHHPGESDGFAGAFFFPGQFYDYRWPMILAGHDTINTGATDPRAGAPMCRDPRPGQCSNPGGIRKIRGDWRETMSTHWFHDHMIDFTAQNVYKGNAAMSNFYSSVDRGREPASNAEALGSPTTPGYGCHYANPNNVNLCLPSGSGLDWGNRDYDVNLVVADKAFDAEGQLFFNTFNLDGFMGDVITVNFAYKPYLDVRARRYRFRILNGAVSRYFKIALVDSAGRPVPFHMVANDGNIMEHAIPFPNSQSPEALPEQGIAERYDIVVDFSGFQQGDKLYLVNLLEHEDGRGPKRMIPLSEVVSGAYSARGCPDNCDPGVGTFMELRVHNLPQGQVDRSMNPADYTPGKKKMIPLPGFTALELATAKERTFNFGRSNATDAQPWTIKIDDDESFPASDVQGVFDRLAAAPDRGSVEIWHIRNDSGGWSHPVHIHFEEGQILQRGGVAPPIWERWARKDMYRVGPLPDSTETVDVAIRVREFLGTFVEHCHNTQHEDHAMLLRWDSQNPGQVVPIRTPFPRWDGVDYVDTNITDVPTHKSGRATTFLSVTAPPLCGHDTFQTRTGVPILVDVFANDECVGSCDAATLLIQTAPIGGTAVPQGDGTILYTPNAGFSGVDSFTYTVRDTAVGDQESAPALVTIEVAAVAPVAAPDTATTAQNTQVVINVIGNDAQCPPCTVNIVNAPSHGIAQANSPVEGQIAYKPATGFTGTDSFSYRASNAAGTSGTATVTVTVTATGGVDVVTISEARLRRNGTLEVKGSVSALNLVFANNVSVFRGPLSASGTCSGAPLGVVAVDRRGKWSLNTRVTSSLSAVCVRSSNGGVADRTVRVDR